MPVPGLGNVEAVAMGERHGWCPASMRVYVKKKKSKCFQANVWCVYCVLVDSKDLRISVNLKTCLLS